MAAHGVEAERHEERDELVGAGLDRDGAEGAEWPGRGAKAETGRVGEQAGAEVVTGAVRIRPGEFGAFDGFEADEQASGVVV